MRRPIVVVGSVNLDLVCVGKRIPAPGETVRGDDFQTFHGGKGANQAVAAARLGSPVRMVAKVGGDDFGKRLRRGLQTAKVNVQAVSTAQDTTSGVALISVDRAGQNSITVVPGANDRLLPGDIEKSLPAIRSAGILLTQLEIPMETVEYLCTVAQRYQIPLMLDPAPARPLPRKLLRQITFLTPNETETCLLCGVSPAELTAATVDRFADFLQGGATNIIIKMGRHGAYLAGSDGVRKLIPAFKVKAVDSTAAGDAFNAGVAVGLMDGLDLVEAVRYGAAAGALATTRPGAQNSMPTASEVKALLAASRGRSSKPRRTSEKAAAQAAD